jgi:hypothetical protein
VRSGLCALPPRLTPRPRLRLVVTGLGYVWTKGAPIRRPWLLPSPTPGPSRRRSLSPSQVPEGFSLKGSKGTLHPRLEALLPKSTKHPPFKAPSPSSPLAGQKGTLPVSDRLAGHSPSKRSNAPPQTRVRSSSRPGLKALPRRARRPQEPSGRVPDPTEHRPLLKPAGPLAGAWEPFPGRRLGALT